MRGSPTEERLRQGRDNTKFSAEVWCLTTRVQAQTSTHLPAVEMRIEWECCGTDSERAL